MINETIKSKDIKSFLYSCSTYKVTCIKEENSIHITSTGGFSTKRDGKYFKLDYYTKDQEILKQLQSLIEKHNISINNGLEDEVEGLPVGYGGTIEIEYATGEKIYKHSNQIEIITPEAEKEIYELFHETAKKNKLDFTSKSSNVQLYDDATEDYLQGIWLGNHFGKKYKIEIVKNHIKIYCDDKLTDDIDYIIIEGYIVPNKLKKGAASPKDHYDYEEYSDISTIAKKNEILIVAYFTKESYSTMELLKERK